MCRVILALLLLPLAVMTSRVGFASSSSGPASGGLLKGSAPTVYYFASDGKRYAFPNEGVYSSWHADFSTVQTMSDKELGRIPFGGNVTYRTGSLLKLPDDAKVYVVQSRRTLRWVTSEDLARDIFGDGWSGLVRVESDAVFDLYDLGAPIRTSRDYQSEDLEVDALLAHASGGAAFVEISGPTNLHGEVSRVVCPAGPSEPLHLILALGEYEVSIDQYPSPEGSQTLELRGVALRSNTRASQFVSWDSGDAVLSRQGFSATMEATFRAEAVDRDTRVRVLLEC